jgi:hypothetical protein
MATGIVSRLWGPELVPTPHGPAHSVQLTQADYRRMAIELREYRRFKAPTFREELKGITMKHEHVIRAATVSNCAFMGEEHKRQAWS